MPPSVVKNAEDAKAWAKAKSAAKAEGEEDNWPYVMSVYEDMRGKKRKHPRSEAARNALRDH